MSGTMANMVGMGSNGMGLGGGLGNIPAGGGDNQGLMQLLMAAHQQQQASQAPFGQGGQTPMAGLMQQAMQHPAMGAPPMQAPQAQQPQQQAPQGGGFMGQMGGPQGLATLLQMFKGGQSGVAAPGAAAEAGAAAGAGGMNPAMLQQLLTGAAGGGLY